MAVEKDKLMKTQSLMVKIFSMPTLPSAGSFTLPELLHELTQKVRSDLKARLPELEDENIDEMSFAALADPSFKSAAKADGGLKNWGRPHIKKVVGDAFSFLREEK